MRVEEVSKPCVELSAESLESKTGCPTLSKARDMPREMALISFLTLRASIHCWVSRSSILNSEKPGLILSWWYENEAVGEKERFHINGDDGFRFA